MMGEGAAHSPVIAGLFSLAAALYERRGSKDVRFALHRRTNSTQSRAYAEGR